jgi:nicotinamide mononucleotide transporter
MEALGPAIAAWWAAVTWTEVFGTLTGLWCVWLYGRESMWAWPIGIVNALLFMVMFFAARLYSDVVLQIIFLLLSVHGWYEWLRGGPARTELSISSAMPLEHLLVLGGVTVVVAMGAGTWFARATDAALPYWDAVILALSLTAQWLLNRKQLETWLVWMLVDIIAVGVYAYRGLLLTAVLYAIFFGLAARGFVRWRRSLSSAAKAVAPLPA